MPTEESNPIKFKIYRPEDFEGDYVWDKRGFRKGEIEGRVKDVIMIKDGSLPNSYKLLVEATYEFPKKEKAAKLGLVTRHGMITRVHYASPFKGILLPGDVIIQVNGSSVAFEEKTGGNCEDKTTVNSAHFKVKPADKKTLPARTDKSSPASHRTSTDFKSLIAKLLGSKTETKIMVLVARLKTRVGTFKVPSGVISSPGYSMELALLYQYKYLKLGLNMQQTSPQRVIVNYTIPDTVSHNSLNIGEAILAVDDIPVYNLDEVRQKILDGCNANGWVRLIVEFPNTDQMKNMIRGQLAAAQKCGDRPQYALVGDVRKYCEEGIDMLKTGKELDPILKPESGKDIDEKEHDKKGKKASKKESLVGFRKITEEVGIPSEWNTKLFVVLPPMKTKETEMGSCTTDNSQLKKLKPSLWEKLQGRPWGSKRNEGKRSILE